MVLSQVSRRQAYHYVSTMSPWSYESDPFSTKLAKLNFGYYQCLKCVDFLL